MQGGVKRDYGMAYLFTSFAFIKSTHYFLTFKLTKILFLCLLYVLLLFLFFGNCERERSSGV